ncbi:MAG TPA: hypothetical protein PLH15_07600 [Spirochaetota bacterium]|nr:hypothetical protein [Spirochaetota bacterium]
MKISPLLRRILLIVIAVVFIFLGLAGHFFGIHLPKKIESTVDIVLLIAAFVIFFSGRRKTDDK